MDFWIWWTFFSDSATSLSSLVQYSFEDFAYKNFSAVTWACCVSCWFWWRFSAKPSTFRLNLGIFTPSNIPFCMWLARWIRKFFNFISYSCGVAFLSEVTWPSSKSSCSVGFRCDIVNFMSMNSTSVNKLQTFFVSEFSMNFHFENIESFNTIMYNIGTVAEFW